MPVYIHKITQDYSRNVVAAYAFGLLQKFIIPRLLKCTNSTVISDPGDDFLDLHEDFHQ
ncbi:hypothetical protein SNOG_16415 [Parastagonospora nodorum SN15]|uniref:Uncharacterized protein n=1 Tax=Phaeosphaeria nodorum (strain SN15 / ATCC MYA-4574 / FGSC 10173) TaxID=321614 RepID=Q0TVU2_PHANO|nr:hypothetical protein SNOG_16415 [Parastagonospora nodorum SN15]EAT76240.1 hypothetical protein SNOG_16415 [Parastagonospora nodorum SN15]